MNRRRFLKASSGLFIPAALGILLPSRGRAQQAWFRAVAANQKAAAGGGGKSSFSDNFNRGNETPLAGNWTVVSGTVNLTSNEVQAPNTSDFTEKEAVYSATACTTVEQYVKVTLSSTNPNGCRPGAIFRYTNSGSAYYEIWVLLDTPFSTVYWEQIDSVGGTQNGVGTYLFSTLVPGDAVGIVCTGTGTGTAINVWERPTANAPTTNALWDGGAPSFSITDDPASPVNTGGYLGIGGIGAAGIIAWDNFFGGDIP
jgi:hypothetical protein